MDEFRQLISICDRYNPSHYVFHSKTGREEEGLWDLRKPALVRSFQEMVNATRNNICMENMVGSFPNTVAGMIEILEQVDGGKCCIDTNHFLLDKTSEAILALGKWLKTIHVSDYDGVYEKHWMPKQGVNNWMKIINALQTVGYNGAFVYEVEVQKYGYSFKEIRENYEKLFEEYEKYSSR
jgi:sugar phosphate isomerase/epimerase